MKDNLAKHEYPRQIELVDELPRTPGGKVNRKALRNRGQANNRRPRRRVMIVKRIASTFPVVVSAVLLIYVPSAPADESDVWNALVQGGHVALIRHGNAPPGYGGDPPGFRFDDCKTQRNMDDKGAGAIEGAR